MVTPEGLRSLKEIGINGKIAVMKHFRPNVSAMERIFVRMIQANGTIQFLGGTKGSNFLTNTEIQCHDIGMYDD